MAFDRLLQLVESGKSRLQKILESNEHYLETIGAQTWASDRPKGKGKASEWDSVLPTGWTESTNPNPANLDNRGFVFLSDNSTTVTNDNILIDRRLDYILSVLESLEVGTGSSEYHHDIQRTACAVSYPFGPNISVLAESTPQHQLAGSSQEASLHVNVSCQISLSLA